MHASARSLGAVALLAAPCVASATSGLAWQFERPVRYHIDVRVQLSETLHVYAERNDEARLSELDVKLTTTCSALEPEGSGWDVSCAIDDIALRGAPAGSDQGRLLPILVEWDGKLTGARVQFELGRDGRVRGVELHDVPMQTEDRRASDTRETMRLLMVRAFAPLDLQLPKKGDDGGKGVWRQRETLALGFFSSRGVVGSAVVEHRIAGVEGDLVDIATIGRGVLGAGDTVSVGGTERVANMSDVTLDGTARFDSVHGYLISRDYTMRGTLTSSAINSLGSEGYDYVQVAGLRWLADDVPGPDVGPTGEIERVEISVESD